MAPTAVKATTCSFSTGSRRVRSSPEAILNRVGGDGFAPTAPAASRRDRSIHTSRCCTTSTTTSAFRSNRGRVCKPGAPALVFVFTVCDNAAGEACPIWPGQPMTSHWGIPDPAEATGTEAEIALAFKDAYRMLNQRIGIFVALPIASLDRLTLQSRLREIGRSTGATAKAEAQ